jgi:hypothetical protein
MKMIIKVDEPPTAANMKNGTGTYLTWLRAQKRYDGKAAFLTPEDIRKNDSTMKAAANAKMDSQRKADSIAQANAGNKPQLGATTPAPTAPTHMTQHTH